MMGESPRPDEIRRMEIGGEFISNLNPHPPTSTHKHTQTHTHTHTRPCTYTHTNPDSTVNGIKRVVYLSDPSGADHTVAFFLLLA